MMCNLRCNTRLVVHETFDKGTNAEYAGLPRMSRYFKICQDMSRTHCFELSPLVHSYPTGRGGRLRETCEELDQGD